MFIWGTKKVGDLSAAGARDVINGGYKNENMATRSCKSYGKICCLYRQDGHKGTQLVVLEGEKEVGSPSLN